MEKEEAMAALREEEERVKEQRRRVAVQVSMALMVSRLYRKRWSLSLCVPGV